MSPIVPLFLTYTHAKRLTNQSNEEGHKQRIAYRIQWPLCHCCTQTQAYWWRRRVN